MSGARDYRPIPQNEEMDAPIPSSPLAVYLADPEVSGQLHKNIDRHLRREQLIGSKGKLYSGMISRLFNHLPGQYSRIQPLLDCLEEALLAGHFETWLDIVLAYAHTDLFDDEHPDQIRSDIRAILNHNKTMDMLDEVFSKTPEVITEHLLSGYVVEIVNEHAAAIVGKLLNKEYKDPAQSPGYQFSHQSNSRLAECNHINIGFATSINEKLITAVNSQSLPDGKLRKCIEDHLFIQALIHCKKAFKQLETDKQKIYLHGSQLIKLVSELYNAEKPSIDRKTLIRILNKTTGLLLSDFDSVKLKEYGELAVSFSKLSTGEKIRSAMYILTTGATVACTLPVTAASLGITAPFTLFGLNVGRSIVTGAITAATSTAGIGGLVASEVNLFKKIFNDSPITTAMKTLVQDGKEKTQTLNQTNAAIYRST